MEWSDALDEFLLRCEAVNLSPVTIKWYRDMLTRVFQSESLRGLKSINQADTACLRAFMAELRRRGVRATSCNGYRRALGAFFGWLVKEELLPDSPARKLERLKEPSSTKRALTGHELELLAAEFDRRSYYGIRNYTIAQLILETGLRVSECCGVRMEDVDLAEGTIVVQHGKGDRRRTVRFGAEMALDLHRYLRARTRELHGRPADYLFLSTRGHGMLQKGTVLRMLARAARKADLQCKVGPHMLRHTSATRLAQNGASAFQIMVQLGHRKITTSQAYVHMAGGLDRQAFSGISPRDNPAGGKTRPGDSA